MPPIGLLLGRVNFSDLFLVIQSGDPPDPYATLALAQEAGAVTVNYGLFINSVTSFLIVAFVMFLVVRSMNNLHRRHMRKVEETTTRECPYCRTSIPIKAERCPNCTSALEAE